MTSIPLSPFQWKGMTVVRGQCPLRLLDMPPPWGGPAEAAK
jgi:hypothetical protein